MTQQIVPIFRVADAKESARWYARLGFELEGEHRFGPNMPVYAFLRWGDAQLHLSEHTGDATPNTLVYLYVDDVEAIAKEFGVPITEQPWARQVSLTDPDGNRLRIGARHKAGS